MAVDMWSVGCIFGIDHGNLKIFYLWCIVIGMVLSSRGINPIFLFSLLQLNLLTIQLSFLVIPSCNNFCIYLGDMLEKSFSSLMKC